MEISTTCATSATPACRSLTSCSPLRYAQDVISEETLNRNKNLLVSYSQRFLDAMTRPELLAKFPRGVRAIGGMTLATAEAAHLDAPAKFVGGFLVLRLLAPALTAPNTAHLVPENTELTELTRRNLVLLSKVIQTLSNRTTVLKEESMKALKEFFDSNFDKMEAFLLEFAQDPQNKEQPFSDLIGAKPKEDATIDKDTLSELHKFLFENLQAFKEAKQPQVCPSHFISTHSHTLHRQFSKTKFLTASSLKLKSSVLHPMQVF